MSDSDIANLEWRVVQKAEQWAKNFSSRLDTIPADDELYFAVDALIAARKAAEPKPEEELTIKVKE